MDLTLISAKGLKDVRHLRRMYLYVSATISGGTSQTTFNTPVNYEGGQNPEWNFSMKFVINEKELMSNSLVLVFCIRCSRAVRGDKDVGDVHVPLKDLFDKSNHSSSPDQCSATTTTLQVRAPSSGTQGELTFSYTFDPNGHDRALQHAPAQPFIVPSASQLPQGYPTFMAAAYTQTTETTTTCVLNNEPPLGYPPLGIGPQVAFPPQQVTMQMPLGYPTAANPVLPFPPPNPTVAPPIATDSPLVLSGIPGVDIDREKTEYELKLEDALSGLLQAIGSLDVDHEDAK